MLYSKPIDSKRLWLISSPTNARSTLYKYNQKYIECARPPKNLFAACMRFIQLDFTQESREHDSAFCIPLCTLCFAQTQSNDTLNRTWFFLYALWLCVIVFVYQKKKKKKIRTYYVSNAQSQCTQLLNNKIYTKTKKQNGCSFFYLYMKEHYIEEKVIRPIFWWFLCEFFRWLFIVRWLLSLVFFFSWTAIPQYPWIGKNKCSFASTFCNQTNHWMKSWPFVLFAQKLNGVSDWCSSCRNKNSQIACNKT